jgi:L-histidine Nalpha-methyltransferase
MQQGENMDAFYASPEMQISRRFHEACWNGTGSTILKTKLQADPVHDFACSIASGLLSAPRRLESRFLYDSEGSALFDKITLQPEYYLTRIEASILAANAGAIREITGPVALAELGSGNSAKTDLLLRAWLDRLPTACYVPVDVSESALAGACSAIAERYPKVRVIGLNCEYQDAFPVFSELSPALVLFLGSSIGNFNPAESARFLTTMASSMTAGDFFLLGVDLVKDVKIIEAAYNDAAGVTAQFSRNVFARMNRELGSSIDLGAIEHVAQYNPEHEQVETYAYFNSQQSLFLAPLDRHLTIPQGEMVQVEISRKFRLERLLPYVEEFGFATEEVFTDDNKWFALILLRRRPRYLSHPRS